MPQKLILDVDTGTDDAVALMCAALHPELDLLAATTVNGNVPVETCTDNSLRVFDHIGVPVPVYQGMHRPMVRDDFPVPRGVGRSDVHGGTLDIPPAHSRAADGHAVDFLIETFMAANGEIVLVPVGPLTNVAMALVREPRLRDAIPEIVLMGGAHATGNVSVPASPTLSGIQASDVVSLTGTPSFTFAQSTVGTSIPITTSGYSLTGADAGNYTLTLPSLSANIT